MLSQRKKGRPQEMDRFATLPEDCISKILSFTSPVDAARSSVISTGFKSAADSDMVWEAFLPSDIQEIITRSDSASVYATKKELYFSLCDSPLVLDGGKMSLSLERRSGKNRYLIAAKELMIWGDTPWNWQWPSHSKSRFSEVAELRTVFWLDIRGRIKTKNLSPRTDYAAYLVFQLAERSYELGSAKSLIRFVDQEADGDAERASAVHLTSSGGEFLHGLLRINGRGPLRRADWWLEVELGSFYNDQGDHGEVEAHLIRRLHGRSALIVEGIEFRPL